MLEIIVPTRGMASNIEEKAGIVIEAINRLKNVKAKCTATTERWYGVSIVLSPAIANWGAEPTGVLRRIASVLAELKLESSTSAAFRFIRRGRYGDDLKTLD